MTVVKAGVVILALVGFIALERATAPKRLETVAPGMLYRSGQLDPDELLDLVDRYAIRSVANLRAGDERFEGDWHPREAAALAQSGVELVELPMYSGFPPDEQVLAEWLDLLEDPGRLPALVHCEHGVLRTGVMVAIYQMEHLGAGPDEAFETVQRFKPVKEPIRTRLRSYLDAYRPRSRRGGEVPLEGD